MDRTQAAEAFAKALFSVGVERSMDALSEGLSNPGGKNKAEWEQAKSLYDGQTDEGRAVLRFMLKEASVLSSFGIAVFLDGASGYYDVEEQPAEFTVAMNLYKSVEETRTPREIVLVCPVKNGEDVHDIFMDLVEEAEAEGYPQASVFAGQ